ncbi:SDR family oxidoreductase [bacterium]|nr:SDR family oxidoreductase [bacterium]
MKVKDKIAIVTGGGGGLGEGIARCLAEEGAHVAVSDYQLDLAEKVAGKVRETGRRAIAIKTDVTSETQVQQMVDTTVKELGGLDIMVCCAGISGFSPAAVPSEDALLIDNIRVEDWDATFAVNVKGVFLCNRAAAPVFRKQNSGRIVNISSVAGRRPSDFLVAYATSKAAVIAFTQSMALLMAPHHVNVNCVCPGIIYTPMWKEGSELLVKVHPALKNSGLGAKEALDMMVQTLIPFKKYQTAEDIGKAVTFLSSSDAEEITGQSLNVCGGMAFN